MYIEIDKKSGFCFGVVHAIDIAERELEEQNELYCIGDIVHNQLEVRRLEKMGMKIISHDDFHDLEEKKVLIRAHGEHPDTYKSAFQKRIKLIDATCPVVLKLQKNIRHSAEQMEKIDGQIVIFGKPNHPEVNGLLGQTLDRGVVISSLEDLDKIDFSRPVSLFVQTTKSIDEFHKVRDEITRRMKAVSSDAEPQLKVVDSICRQMSNRVPALQEFVKRFDLVIFVSGRKSSNGTLLYKKCKEINESTYFVSDTSELSGEWFKGVGKVGICGATSTPMWLMEDIADVIKSINE